MMEACLGVTTYDKCGTPMKEDKPVLVIAEGSGNKSGKEPTFKALAFNTLVILTAGM